MILKSQILCLGPWVGSPGSGYGSELTNIQKFENINPTKLIFNTSASALINLTLLEQISSIPQEILDEINQLNYDFKRIESIQDFKNQIVTSDLKLTTSLRNKINNSGRNVLFETFLNQLTDKEKNLAEILLNFGSVIHCNVIGNKSHGSRQHWEKIYKWITSEEKKYEEPDYTFIVVSFLSFFLIFFPFFINFLNLFLISFILIFIVSVKSGAIK